MRLVDQPPPQPGEEIRALVQRRHAGLFRGDGRAAARRAACSTIATARRRRGWSSSAKRSPSATCATSIRSASASRSARRASRSQTEIVGVVPSLRHERLDEAPRAEVLMPFAQSPTGSMTLVARTSVDPAHADRDRQARDLGDRSAADVLPHGHARGAGRSDADHAALCVDRADGIRRRWRCCWRPPASTAC